MQELNILPPLVALEINLLLGAFALAKWRRGRRSMSLWVARQARAGQGRARGR